ncbi:class I SAM-dependent methyltransferase [Cupriavidus consociatus]|uniref:class I SAM-dependent methyltransferase n=1 Tax=Cupriavidus consociatus TaxID=2821357 RepID=UPI001AE1BFA0|nr:MULTISPECIES: class I SAM-dependent methyltransferase [unclassified Cupriavidus]MBP0620283.1 class I SAM-dependent methyltransferase [Cupriavidus sp. LEh25]MDK2656939.1 class I SAM-dependent methyltransferase [Cupriavidus sp. LEh21]
MSVDEARLNAFMEKFVHDIGAVMHAATVVVGDELGLYKAMAEKPMTADVLAQKTHTDVRYLREWLSAQAASGYVDYDPDSAEFSLNEEQAFALAQEGSPAFIPGAFQIAVAQFRAIPKMIDIFRNGRGLGWHEHDPALFHGTERFFRPGYAAHLVSEWIPALDGIEARLKRGASVADVGCGHGASTIIMAQAYPASRFVGFDYHEPSVRHATEAARRAGVGDRVRFEVASAKDYAGRDYDLVAVFDCLHDMGDPVGAARHVRETLRPDGAWMIVEPFANDKLEDNLNPVGRVFYSASTFICTPASRSQEVGLCLGAQAGEARMRGVAEQAGFGRFRRAAQTPFNLVYEARPLGP